MENSNQNVQGIVDYISQLVSLNRRLQKKKVDLQTAKLAFTQLDTKRKGYLDLANVYQLCGNVTQDQLFYVFKWLDNSKTGDVTYDDFQWVIVTNQSNQKNLNNNPVDSVKLTISTYLQNFDYSQNLKRKLNITVQNLKKFYLSLCQSQRKSSLSVQDLIYVFSHSKRWDNLCQQEIKNLFRQSKCISQKIFIEKFASFDENSSNQCTFQNQQKQKKQQNYNAETNQQQLLEDINTEYLVSRNSTSQNNKNKFQQNNWIKINDPCVVERQNYLGVIKNTQNLVKKQTQDHSKTFKQDISKNSTQNKLGQIQSMLSNIQKRRQQLRKGSLQRKKLIQQALSRKKTINLSRNNNIDLGNQQFVCTRPNSSSKTNSNSRIQFQERYLNHSPTAQFGRNINFNTFNPNERSQKVQFNKYDQGDDKFYQSNLNLNRRYNQPEVKNNRTTENFYSNIQKAQYCQNNRLTNKLVQSQAKFNKYKDYKDQEPIRPQTPKFSQTAHDRFFQRPLSSQKPDRISQLRQKINNLPEKNVQKDERSVDYIIQKYKHLKGDSNFQLPTNHSQSRSIKQPSAYQQPSRNYIDSYIKNNNNFVRQTDFQSRNHQYKFEPCYQRRSTPDSYLQEPKTRLNGSIYSYKMNSGSIQKQNLLKRAQQQAARKIQQIQRKAKMKVLQRKSAVGLKWIK